MSISPWTRNSIALFLRLFLAFISPILFFQIGAVSGFAQTTNFAIGTTVQQPNVSRFGINLSGQNYYDSGQMLRNVTIRNPGFEGQQWQVALDCVAVTASSCTDANPWNVWPANTLAGATFEVVNGTAAGETGTISGNTVSDYEAGNSTNPSSGLTVNFSSPLSTPLAAGDYIIARMQQSGDAWAGWWTSTNGGASLLTDTTDIAPDSPGKQALEISASGSGQSADVISYFDTTSGRSFLQMQGTYTLTFRAKGLGGSNQVNVSVERLATEHGNVTYLNQNVGLTGQWQDYSFSFTANEDGTYIGPVELTFAASGASLYLDDVALTATAASDNPTAYRNEVVDRLRQLQPGVIRLMTGQDIGSTIDNELAVPFARMRSNFNSQSVEQDDIPMGLHEFLVLCQAVGAEPWFTMSGETSATDMQDLIEYLAGDASTPYGQIRASLGQSQPWTTVFPEIHLELGNEMWNPTGMPGEQIADPVAYGQRAALIFGAARSSPYYNPSSFDLIMGSWADNSWWTQQEMLNSSGYDSVDAAPYLFNTFSDYSSNENIFGPMFAQPEQIDSTSSGYMAEQQQAAAAGSPPAKLEVYEVNLSTASGTAPQNVVTQVVGGVGAGIAVADHLLLMMRDLGITVENVFALSEFTNGFINTATGSPETMPLWGTTIDMGGETNVNRPTFLAEQLANSAIMPTMLSVAVTGANPTWNQPLSANDTETPIQLANAHYLQSFAFTDGTHYSVVVFNLSRSGSLPVTFSGANAPTGNVLISQLTSQNITDNNENLTSDAPMVNTTTSNVANFNPSTPYSLPPFSMTVFSWPNAMLPSTTTTLGASPVSAAAGAQVTFTATVTSQSVTNTPTGTVTFMNGSTTLGTATLNSSGVATFSTAALPAGTDSITASYGGDPNNASSVSPVVTVTITSSAVPTTTTLSASPMQANTGQSVTLTATVAPSSGTTVPQGTVTFLNGTASLGSATLSASGVATLSTTSLPAGADSITASYAGTDNDAASVSAAVAVNVTQTISATTAALIASATQISPGQTVTLMVTVTPQSGSPPAGTVTFLNGATTLGTATLNSSGAASLSTSALPNGANSITASYAGSTSDSASVSPAVTVTVAQGVVTTATALTSSATSINTGQSLTFTAKVAQQSGTAVPSGTVAFLNGSAILGTATLNSSGVATFSTTALPAGSDSITASYGGTAGFNSSVSPAVTITVTQTLTATSTTLSASAAQINTGQSVTFTAAVAPQSGTTTPTGAVTFLDGTTSLGTATLNASGVASLSIATLAAGSHSITASYGGSTSNSSSVSPVVTVAVMQTQVTTATTLTASASSVNTGQSVTFTATVAPKTGTTVPAGTVTFFNGGAVLGASTLNGNGAAAFTTRSLPAGSDSITASYGGSTSAASSSSAAVVVTVTQSVIATTTTLAVSAVQLAAGQSLTLTAAVTPQSGSAVPSGSVTFLDGSTALGTVSLSGSGAASFSTSSLAAGTHSITASYAGSTSNSASVSTPVSVQVAPAPVHTTTALSASPAAINTGQSVTLTATVVPDTPGSTLAILPVAFLDGSTIIGTANVNSSGVATFTTTALPAGSDSITASYTGNAVDLSSVSAPAIVTVTQTVVATTTALTASSTQITAGQSVTFSAKVTAHSGTPTGTVTFLDGSTPLGTGTLNRGGTALFATTALGAGTHSITASYGGDQGDSASVSAAVPVTVTADQEPTTTALTASATAVNTGQVVSFTATVVAKAGGAVPTGAVAFLDGASILGSATLNASGIATFTTTALPAGTQSISASYGGSTTASSSVSNAVTVQVTQTVTGTTTTLAASASEIGTGDNVVFTATVLPGAGGATPTGTVTFLDGSAILGTGALNGNGIAFFSTNQLVLGTHEVTASYSGNSADSKSVSPQAAVIVFQTIQPTSTLLATSATQVVYGANVTLTATVSQQSGGAVSGSVVFLDGSTILATAQLSASGIAVLNTRTLEIGTHSITASFVGNTGDGSSASAPVSINVLPSQAPSQSTTTIFLTASATQVTPGQSVTFTATLVSSLGNYSLSGAVTFWDGSNLLGTAQIGGNGSASVSTSALNVGTHSIIAVYGGNDQTAGAISSPVTVVVQPATLAAAPILAATTTILTSSASQVSAGDPVTFTATVADQTGSGMPSGTVQFLDGATVLGSVSLGSGGTAKLTTSSLAVGTHSITAAYGGDSSNGASSSAAVSVVVAAAGTPGYTMTVSASNVSVTPGEVANLTVTLTPENGFNMPVNLTCSSPLQGTTCSFSPPTVTPNGGPVTSTLSVLVASSAAPMAESRTPPSPFDRRMALGMVMPWGIFSLMGFSRRKNRSLAKAWSIRVIVAVALVAGSLWISGCGYQVNGSAFTMTLTSSGANVPTHTSQITVNVLQ